MVFVRETVAETYRYITVRLVIVHSLLIKKRATCYIKLENSLVTGQLTGLILEKMGAAITDITSVHWPVLGHL